jgi:hypothetical protein
LGYPESEFEWLLEINETSTLWIAPPYRGVRYAVNTTLLREKLGVRMLRVVVHVMENSGYTRGGENPEYILRVFEPRTPAKYISNQWDIWHKKIVRDISLK